MILVEKDRIGLDAEIQEYVPTFPAKQWPVTLRQLAAHLGGVRHYKGSEYMQNAFGTIQEGLAAFQDDPLGEANRTPSSTIRRTGTTCSARRSKTSARPVSPPAWQST